MADTGWVDVGTGADDSSYGSVTWTSTSAIVSDNDAGASYNSTISPSHYLKGTNVGLSVPAGATIDGIEVRFEARVVNVALFGADLDRIRLVDADGTIGTTDRSDGVSFTATDTFYPYGGASDLWGDTWSEANVEDIDFGFVIAAVRTGIVAAQMLVDVFQVKVYYTEDGGPPPTISLVMAPHTPM